MDYTFDSSVQNRFGNVSYTVVPRYDHYPSVNDGYYSEPNSVLYGFPSTGYTTGPTTYTTEPIVYTTDPTGYTPDPTEYPPEPVEYIPGYDILTEYKEYPIFSNYWQEPIDTTRLVNSFKYFKLDVSLESLIPANENEYVQVTKDIWNKFHDNVQSIDTFRNKMKLWKDVFDLIQPTFPTFGLQVVGSTFTGFGSNSSDVDMCLLVRAQEVDQSTEAIPILKKIYDCLQNSPFNKSLKLIYAKVPILKFYDPTRKLDIDLNCNNFVGMRNTHLLYCYSQYDWRVRPLVSIVKMWAQQQGINDAKNMTLSSYSLTLMVIHFLQCGCSPSDNILPNIQETFDERYSNLISLVNIRTYEDSMNHRFPLLQPFKTKNTQCLGVLLVNFLKYFGCKFEYSKHAMSVRTGSCVSISSCMHAYAPKNDSQQWKFLCIEEPFELTNTARSVYDRNAFDRIRGVFFTCWQRLVITMDLESIFSVVKVTEAQYIGAELRRNNRVVVYKRLTDLVLTINELKNCKVENNNQKQDGEAVDDQKPCSSKSIPRQ